MKVSTSQTRAMRHRTMNVALAAILVLAAGVLPACVCVHRACCLSLPDAPTVHSQMPCCDVPSVAPRDLVRVQPATFAGLSPSPQPWASVAVVMQPDASPSSSRVQATLATVTLAHYEPSPPLFLLNAQFLI